MASNTLQNYEQVSYGGPGLSMHRGKAVQIIGDAVATRTLTAKEAGSMSLWDSAAGVIYTLPSPIAGQEFEFFCTVTITSGNATVQTNLATEFILGEVFTYTTATASGAGFAFNGSSHVKCQMNGTTSGGIIGSWVRLRALSSTVWAINGLIVGSGTIVTPAA